MRVIVGGRTCSASASSPRVINPLCTTTESADKRGAVKPMEASVRRRPRSKRSAVEWQRLGQPLGFLNVWR